MSRETTTLLHTDLSISVALSLSHTFLWWLTAYLQLTCECQLFDLVSSKLSHVSNNLTHLAYLSYLFAHPFLKVFSMFHIPYVTLETLFLNPTNKYCSSELWFINWWMYRMSKHLLSVANTGEKRGYRIQHCKLCQRTSTD